jgi:glucose/arabinose dehydrogenase
MLRLFGLLCLLWAISPISAQSLPPCDQRPGWRFAPRVNAPWWCFEEVIAEKNAGELAFTALAFAPDGRLFAARPLHGQVLMLRDTDGDFLPDSPQIIADNLTLPNALVYHNSALYIAGGQHLYRLPDAGTLEILVDDLPSGTGFWTGGLAIGADERLYVGIGAPCDDCLWENPERGAILSFALDGSDKQLVAQGLRQPAGLAFYQGALWVTDTARYDLAATPALDELNQVTAGAHFGFPHCIGYLNTPDIGSENFDCAQATAPVLALATHSTPLAMVEYHGAAFPFMQDKLIVVLGGSFHRSDVRGYEIIAVDPRAEFIRIEPLVPFDAATTPGFTYTEIYEPEKGYANEYTSFLNRRGAGFWAHRLYSVAISPEGWLYFSVGGGRIVALRSP